MPPLEPPAIIAASPPDVVFGIAELIEPLDLPEVSYDADEIIDEALSLVGELEARVRERGSARILGPAFVERCLRTCAVVKAKARGGFRIAVIGEFKRGKSTLVNALVGRVVAPTDPLPETMTINSYAWGEAFSAELRLADGGRLALAEGDLSRSRLSRLVAGIRSFPVGIDAILPAKILRDAVLIDTPGLGDLDHEMRRQISAQIADSDLVVLVVSAGAPLSLTERDMLRTMVHPCDFPKMLWAVNMIDVIETSEDIARVEGHVSAAAGQLFPGSQVFMISALDECARETAARRPRPQDAAGLEARFSSFRGEIEALIAGQRRIIRADRVLTAGFLAFTDIHDRLAILSASLDGASQDLDRELAACESSVEENAGAWARREQLLGDLVQGLGREAAGWMREFAARLLRTLPDQVVGLPPDQAERELQFFVASAVEAALTACLEAHTPALAEACLLAQAQASDARTGLDLTKAGLLAGRTVYAGSRFSSTDAVRQVVEQVTGAGLVFDVGAAIVDGLTGRRRSGQVADVLNKGRRELAETFAEAAAGLYRNASAALAERLLAEARHTLDIGREGLRQARALRDGREDSFVEARLEVGETAAWVIEARERLDVLRQRIR